MSAENTNTTSPTCRNCDSALLAALLAIMVIINDGEIHRANGEAFRRFFFRVLFYSPQVFPLSDGVSVLAQAQAQFVCRNYLQHLYSVYKLIAPRQSHPADAQTVGNPGILPAATSSINTPAIDSSLLVQQQLTCAPWQKSSQI
jgi:hypothetical protein